MSLDRNLTDRHKEALGGNGMRWSVGKYGTGQNITARAFKKIEKTEK